MADFEIGNLIYLVVLGGVLLGSVLLSRRNEVSKVLKEAGIWVILFIVVIAVVAGWQDIRTAGGQFSSNVTEQGEIIIPQQRDGHYHLTLTINGAAVDFLVDTGASDIVLTQSDAEKIGFDTKQLEYWGTASTANGTVRLAVVRLKSVELGPYKDTNIRAAVNEGQMSTSLLGMAYLDRFGSIQIEKDRMILRR